MEPDLQAALALVEILEQRLSVLEVEAAEYFERAVLAERRVSAAEYRCRAASMMLTYIEDKPRLVAQALRELSVVLGNDTNLA